MALVLQLLRNDQLEAYIVTFAQAAVRVEDTAHPLFKGVPATFSVTTEEWYTWDKNPRPNVNVLANVDESTYMPNSTIKMGGDHPVIWSNDTVKAKNVYIFMGHHPNLFQNTAWTTLFRNAIFWPARPSDLIPASAQSDGALSAPRRRRAWFSPDCFRAHRVSCIVPS